MAVPLSPSWRMCMTRALKFRLLVLFHLFLVYISWGTTYIGFRLTLEVVGPFFACGLRMALGGLLLSLLLLLFGKWQSVTGEAVRHAAFFGMFLVVAASGFLSFGQQYLPSGIAAVITGSTPITMIIGGWLFAGEEKPGIFQWLGFLGGSTGLVLLTLEQCSHSSIGYHSLIGVFFVLMATFGWVAGSLLIKRNPRVNPLPPLQDCALLLLFGGLECLFLGLLFGEQNHIHYENFHVSILLAFSWMVIGGAIFAYSSYFWLLRHVSITVAISYEYVVPVIAIFFGWLVCDETISFKTIISCTLTISSVFLVIHHKHNR